MGVVEAALGYLTVRFLRGAGQVANAAVDSLLDRLAGVVASRIGSQSLDELAAQPRNDETREKIGRNIAARANVDPTFNSALKELVAELDELGGRQLVNEVYAQYSIQAIGAGSIAAGRDVIYAPTDVHVPDPTDISGAPGWVKLFIGVGFLTCVAGLGIFFYTLFTDMPDLNDPNFGETPSGIPIAFGVFFVGFAIAAIGSIGRAMSRRH